MEPTTCHEDESFSECRNCGPQTGKAGFRWVMSRKADILSSIRGGRITFHQACSAYAISAEELTAWQEAFQRMGYSGLRATRRNVFSPTIGSADVLPPPK